MEKSVIIDNGSIRANILLPGWGYDRSRYDWGGMVEQVWHKGHTFLSKELNSSGGVGLGGVGLVNVFEWRDTALYDSASVADYFPLPGVGLLKKTDTSPFLFTKDYPTVPFEHAVETGEDFVKIRTLPHLCCGVAMDMEKLYTLEGSTLHMDITVRNVGPKAIHATEFSHNFFNFDGGVINSDYRLSFPYTIEPKLRRGELIIERDAYRLGEFDGPTESSAFWIRGWEGLKSHWMKLENAAKGMSVLIEDDVPVCNFYSWNNFNAFCPEVFAPIDLESGESVSYRRSYTFEVK